jgi:hypothetical protein
LVMTSAKLVMTSTIMEVASEMLWFGHTDPQLRVVRSSPI